METRGRKHESATIHRFPPGGRAGAGRKAAQANPISPRSGSGWYHEQAIKDARDGQTHEQTQRPCH